jgi:hypothetical protein
MSAKLHCPICKDSSAVRILAESTIYVDSGSERKTVGTQLAAFHCERSWHVFLVRIEDLLMSDIAMKELVLS